MTKFVPQKVDISKLDAAVRQLDTAITIFLSHGDIVSIHTLIAASHGILRDIANLQGKESFIKDKLVKDYSDPKVRKQAFDTINQAQNFFKHANRDHQELLEFNPAQSEIMIWDACSLYQELTGERRSLHIIFTAYFFANNPVLLNKNEEVKIILEKLKTAGYRKGDRQLFLSILPQLLKNQHS